MSSKDSNHLERTSQSTRQEIVSKATVTNVTSESSTVKSLILKIHNKNFMFKAGQWVDTHIPGIDTVGGFSMCSSPLLLKQKGIIQLAVKYSNHPPTEWIHQKCKVGDTVELKVGGDFIFDPPPGQLPRGMILVAGGIGINPLYCILQHTVDLSEEIPETERPSMLLLYSTKTLEELVFKKNIDEICKKFKNVKVQYFITSQTVDETGDGDNIEYCRINVKRIEDAIEEMKSKNTDDPEVFVCGPTALIDSTVEHLDKFSVPKEHIHFEKWWK